MKVKALPTLVALATSLLLLACDENSQIFTEAQQAIQQVSNPGSTSKITVEKTEFGIVKVDPTDFKVSFTPTNKVPLTNDTAYGWRIQLKGYQGQVTWREVFKLPKPAQNWVDPVNAEFSVSEDRIQAITRRTVYTQDGAIGNTWTVIPGDPPGKYVIQVYVDNRQVGTFQFDLVASK